MILKFGEFSMSIENQKINSDDSDHKYIFLDREDIKKMFRWKSDSALYNAIKNDGFPEPLRVGGRRSLWRQNEIFAWIDTLEQKLSR